MSNSHIQANYRQIRDDINALRPEAQLLAVSKYTTDENIQTLYACGQRDFGENRVPELLARAQRMPADIRWHFIGNLQSNKIKKLLGLDHLVAIHSVDRLGILEKLIEQAQKLNRSNSIDIYLQVNLGQEKEKHGFTEFEQLNQAVELCLGADFPSSLHLAGLMTMAAIRTDHYTEDAGHSFELLGKWRERLIQAHPAVDLKLNMGMSRDYKLALQKGSQLIRVGSTLFKE